MNYTLQAVVIPIYFKVEEQLTLLPLLSSIGNELSAASTLTLYLDITSGLLQPI
jgi:hypothetical protein